MKSKTLANKILDFYFTLEDNLRLPNNVKTIFPFQNEETQRVMRLFFEKYYSDTNSRVFIFGINPGRFGSGITGIGFCDAKNLALHCGIKSSFEKRSEISANFIFEVIEAYGGAKKFYGDFYITSTSVLGFVKEHKNYNYYDDKKMEVYLEKFILESIQKQLDFGHRHKDIICVGKGKNLKYLKALNKKYKLFGNIHTVPHPRWVMQYKRKDKQKYIAQYVEVLKSLV